MPKIPNEIEEILTQTEKIKLEELLKGAPLTELQKKNIIMIRNFNHELDLYNPVIDEDISGLEESLSNNEITQRQKDAVKKSQQLRSKGLQIYSYIEAETPELLYLLNTNFNKIKYIPMTTIDILPIAEPKISTITESTSAITEPQISTTTEYTSAIAEPQISTTTESTSAIIEPQISTATESTSAITEPHISTATESTSPITEAQISTTTESTSAITEPQISTATESTIPITEPQISTTTESTIPVTEQSSVSSQIPITVETLQNKEKYYRSTG